MVNLEFLEGSDNKILLDPAQKDKMVLVVDQKMAKVFGSKTREDLFGSGSQRSFFLRRVDIFPHYAELTICSKWSVSK
jgi:hypothetical protein